MIGATGATKAAYDVVIIGAGPAGLAAAATTARRGSRHAAARRERDARRPDLSRRHHHARRASASILGEDYWARRAPRRRGRGRAAPQIVQGATVWSLDAAREIGVSCRRRLAPAAGAPRHPRDRRARAAVPDPRLDLARRDDGRRRADAAEGLGPRPRRPPGAGRHRARCCGCWLRSCCGRAARIEALLDTTPRRNYLRALPHAAGFVLSPYFAKGLALLREVARQVRIVRGVTQLARRGRRASCARSPTSPAPAREQRLAVDVLLLHQGVVPNVNLAMAAGIAHRWDRCSSAGRRCSMQLGNSSIARHRHRRRRRRHRRRARGAEARGRLAGLAAVRGARARARRAPARSPGAGPGRWRAADAGRAFLDQLFAPPPQFRMPEGDTIVCRCEEVTAAQIRDTVDIGCDGPQPDEGVPALRHGTVPGPAVRPHRHRADRGGARHDARPRSATTVCARR